MSNLAEFTDDNFQAEVLDADQPVLVDFWGPHCMPCLRMMPMIEKLAEENAGSIKIGKINTQENIGMAQKYDVFTVPTLLIFKNGEIVERMGQIPMEQLQKKLDAAKG